MVQELEFSMVLKAMVNLFLSLCNVTVSEHHPVRVGHRERYCLKWVPCLDNDTVEGDRAICFLF